MPDDYYQNTLYPLQDKILEIFRKLPVSFYLTGGTVLSRVYLHHRYSDDLDFFTNSASDFKEQIKSVIKEFQKLVLKFEVTVADEGFVRLFVYSEKCSLKLDFVNDVQYRSGVPFRTLPHCCTAGADL